MKTGNSLLALVVTVLLAVGMAGGCGGDKTKNGSSAPDTSGSIAASDGTQGSADASSPTGSDLDPTQGTVGTDDQGKPVTAPPTKNGSGGTTTTTKGDGKNTTTTNDKVSVGKNDFSGRVSNLHGREIRVNTVPNQDPNSIAVKEMRQSFKEIEAEYNCKITEVPMHNESGGVTTITQSVMAGKPVVDIWIQNGPDEFLKHYKAGLLTNLSNLKVFDFDSKDSPYSVDKLAMKMGGSYYAAVGGLSTNKTWSSLVMFCNMGLLKQYVPDEAAKLYNYQINGDWTWDKFEEICKKFNTAVANAGKSELTACFDQLMGGYVSLLATRGTDWAVQKGDGIVFNGNDAKAKAALDQYAGYVNDGIIKLGKIGPAGAIAGFAGSIVGYDNKYAFAKNQSVFVFNQVGGYYWNIYSDNTTMQKVKDESMVLFLPKMSKSDAYTAAYPMEASGHAIPSNVSKPNEVATILNAIKTRPLNGVKPDPAKNKRQFLTEEFEPALNKAYGSQSREVVSRVYDLYAAGKQKYLVSALSVYCTKNLWGDKDEGWLSKYVFDIAWGKTAHSTALATVTKSYNNYFAQLAQVR